MFTRVQGWLDERFHWADIVGPLKKKTVPIHRLSYLYFLGGITLFLFLSPLRRAAHSCLECSHYKFERTRIGMYSEPTSHLARFNLNCRTCLGAILLGH